MKQQKKEPKKKMSQDQPQSSSAQVPPSYTFEQFAYKRSEALHERAAQIEMLVLAGATGCDIEDTEFRKKLCAEQAIKINMPRLQQNKLIILLILTLRTWLNKIDNVQEEILLVEALKKSSHLSRNQPVKEINGLLHHGALFH